MYKKYVVYSVLTLLGILFFISLINFIIDPGKIYFRKIMNDYYTDKYVSLLKNQEIGLVQEGWNERSVKVTLANSFDNVNCIVLGSSHILQISSIRNTGNIKKQCKNLINLGVSGGSLEDIFVFSNIILNKKILPEQVFIGIDPWTLKFNMDSRYLINKKYYILMLKYLNIENTIDIQYESKIIENLINKEYLLRSLDLIFKEDERIFDFSKIQKVTEKFDFDTGFNKAVTLSDGSHVYNKSWIVKQKDNIKKLPYGGGDYKIGKKPFEQLAIDSLVKLLEFYKREKIKVNFLMTPYHPNVFKKGKTKVVEYMKIVEKKVFELSDKYDIEVYGSFFPKKLNCNENEFFDFMHAKTSCLNKIDLSGNIK